MQRRKLENRNWKIGARKSKLENRNSKFDYRVGGRAVPEAKAAGLHEGLVIYTDGVSEAMNPADEEWGEARMIEAIERSEECRSECFQGNARFLVACGSSE
jgi:hypothetical protein